MRFRHSNMTFERLMSLQESNAIQNMIIQINGKLLKATQRGDHQYIKQFLDENPNYDISIARYVGGDSMLHVASRLGYTDIVKTLLDHKFVLNVDIRNDDNKTPLHDATQFCRYDAAETLLNCGANVNALKKADWTPLMLACTKIVDSHENLRVVELLVTRGAIVDYRNKDGWTPFHILCREGNVNIMTYLFENGLNMELRTNNGRTGLHIASLHGNYNLVQLLLRTHMSIEVTDNCGNTPLHDAVLSRNIEVLKLLLRNGANTNAKNKEGFTALHIAAAEGNLEIIRYLVEDLNVPVDAANDLQVVPLHCAAKKKQREAYDLLVKLGADENCRDKFGRIPMDYFTQ